MSHTDELMVVFFEALRVEPARRNEFISLTCSDDLDLAREVELLLTREAELIRPLDALFHRTDPGVRSGGAMLRIGPFIIHRRLDSAGEGFLYEGRRLDDPDGPAQLIKVVDTKTSSALAVDRLRRERDFLMGGTHRSVPRLLETGTTHDGQLYVATELPTGEPFFDFCRQLDVPIPHRVEIFRCTVAALVAAHREGVTQWELTPEMIRVGADGQPSLMGLNLAGTWPRNAPSFRRREQSSRVIGGGETLNELLDDSVQDNLHDLGHIYYQLVTDQLASWKPRAAVFGLPRTSEMRVVEPSRVHHARHAELHGDLDRIADRLLTSGPTTRYARSADLLRDLDRYLERQLDPEDFGRSEGRFATFVRRNRWGVLTTVLGALLAGNSWVWSLRQTREADRRSAEARNLSLELVHRVREAARQPYAPGESSELRFARLALEYVESQSQRPDLSPDLRRDLAEALIDLQTPGSVAAPLPAHHPAAAESSGTGPGVTPTTPVEPSGTAPTTPTPKAEPAAASRGGKVHTIRGTGAHSGINLESRDWGPALERWLEQSKK